MAYEDYPLVEVTFDGNVGIVAMNMPDRMNPTSVAGDVRDAMLEMETDANVRAVVWTGKGRAFSAGGDLKGVADGRGAEHASPTDATAIGRWLYGHHRGGPAIRDGLSWQFWHDFRKPIIGAVKGYALGGGWEFAQQCDLIVAGENLKLGAVEILLGLYPFGMGSQYLAKTVGKHRALELMMTGELIDAQTALDWGLVNRVVPDDDVLPKAIELAHVVADQSPLPIGVIKYLVDKAIGVDEHYDLERALAQLLQYTDDAKAAMKWRVQAYKDPDLPKPDFQMR